MSLVDSLLGAIVRLDGDSLVLHTGEKPYVVTARSSMNAFRGPIAWGQVELSTRTLSSEAVLGMLEQMLTPEQRRDLDQLGAVENELPATGDRPGFAVVAARGGSEIWVEIRPLKVTVVADAVEAAPPVESTTPEEPAVAIGAAVAQETTAPPREAPAPEPAPVIEPPIEAPVAPAIVEPLSDQRRAQFIAPEPAAEAEEPQREKEVEEPQAVAAEIPLPLSREEPAAPAPFEIVPEIEQERLGEEDVAQLLASSGLLESPTRRLVVQEDDETEAFVPVSQAIETQATETPEAPEVERRIEEPASTELEEITLETEPAPTPAVVVPMSRTIREAPDLPRSRPPAIAGGPFTSPEIERLLLVAAARGASGLYLVAQSRPTVRVDGEMQQLDGEEPLSGSDVEALMLALAPEPTRDAVRSGETSEWFRDVDEVGRVRCLSFRDHRGSGLIVRMLPERAISAEQLGLSKDIRALCGQPDGLVLVVGPRASGKSTLMAAFVDLVNRTRADHVITIERQISFVHESRRSFVSQREVRGEAGEVHAVVRAALREDPDVLVVEEVRSAEVIGAVLEAAESGRLVLAGMRAPAAVQALERLIDQVPAERRAHALAALSASLRAVVGQVLLRKRGGGRVAARELLLNTPAAASIIAEGKLFQLGAAIESGRKLGSLPLNDGLVALIRDGIVDAGEAWRKAYDREGLLTQLKREGIDTSFVERLA